MNSILRFYEIWFAIRYLKSKRDTGGVSIMTIISFVGISLAVFALVSTISVRNGFKEQFLKTVLGSSPHITLYATGIDNSRTDLYEYNEVIQVLQSIPSINGIWPVIQEKVMVSSDDSNSGAEIIGIDQSNLEKIPLMLNPEKEIGELDLQGGKIAIGYGLASSLNVGVGDYITLISPNGIVTPFGRTPLIEDFEVSYIFQVGRFDVDSVRIFMSLSDAANFFGKDGYVDNIQIFSSDPESIEELQSEIGVKIRNSLLPGSYILWSWKDASGAYLAALDLEDNAMFIIMSILVLIASLNIVSGLIMLVKNKGRDIGILRTIGYTEGSILRIFFFCGSIIGVLGTVTGVILGVIFSHNVNSVIELISYISGSKTWDPSVRILSQLPAKLETSDILWASSLSLGLSFFITYFPARRAAKMNPVEALRNE